MQLGTMHLSALTCVWEQAGANVDKLGGWYREYLARYNQGLEDGSNLASLRTQAAEAEAEYQLVNAVFQAKMAKMGIDVLEL